MDSTPPYDEAGARPNGAPTPAPPIAASAAARDEWSRDLPPAVPSGIEPLDRVLRGGLRAESMYVLSGKAGGGKSSLAAQVTSSIARDRSVVYLTSELSVRQVLARVAAQVLGRPWLELYEGDAEDGAIVADALEGLWLRVVAVGREADILGPLDAAARADGQEPVVVVDYLQHVARRIVRRSGRQMTERMATSETSDMFAQWASDRRSMVLALSSVARGWYQSSDERTAADYLGAAKESGDVEADASGMLHLDADTCPAGGEAAARLHVAKSRFSAGGTIGLTYAGATGIYTPNAAAALSDDQREALIAIDRGVTSNAAVAKEMGVRRARADLLVAALRARGLIEPGRGLRTTPAGRSLAR